MGIARVGAATLPPRAVLVLLAGLRARVLLPEVRARPDRRADHEVVLGEVV